MDISQGPDGRIAYDLSGSVTGEEAAGRRLAGDGRSAQHVPVPRPRAGRRGPPRRRHGPAALRADLAEPGRWAAVAAMTRADHRAAAASLGDVRAPALVVMGSDDPDFPDPAEEARSTAELLGGPAEVLMVPGTGHYPHVQRPDVVNPAMTTFLAGLPGHRAPVAGT